MYIFQAIRGARMLAHVMALSLLLATVALSQRQKQQNYDPTSPRVGLYDGSNSQHQHQQQSVTGSENQDNLGEHVDRMSSPSGDLYWNKQQQQQRQQPLPDWYRILLNRVGSVEHRAPPVDQFSEGASLFLDVPLTNQYQLSLVGGMMRDQQQQQHKPQQQDGLLVAPELMSGRTGKRQISGYPNQQIGGGQPSVEYVGGGSTNNNYRDLVDQFKHWSPVANPSRESRAFKPKLMSTARGFGKRAEPVVVVGGVGGGGLTRQVSYADFLVASNTDPYGGSVATSSGGVDDEGKRGIRK